MNNNLTLDSWEGIVDNLLKADNLKGKKGAFIAEEVLLSESIDDEGNKRPQMSVQTKIEGEKYKFILNWTNLSFVKTKVKTPSELKGKSILWEKTRVKNPKTNQMVDSISIVDIQDN